MYISGNSQALQNCVLLWFWLLVLLWHGLLVFSLFLLVRVLTQGSKTKQWISKKNCKCYGGLEYYRALLEIFFLLWVWLIPQLQNSLWVLRSRIQRRKKSPVAEMWDVICDTTLRFFLIKASEEGILILLLHFHGNCGIFVRRINPTLRFIHGIRKSRSVSIAFLQWKDYCRLFCFLTVVEVSHLLGDY